MKCMYTIFKIRRKNLQISTTEGDIHPLLYAVLWELDQEYTFSFLILHVFAPINDVRAKIAWLRDFLQMQVGPRSNQSDLSSKWRDGKDLL